MVNSDPYNSLWTKIPIWTGWYNPLYTANNTCFNHCKNSTWKNSSEVSWVALKAGRALRRSVSHGFFSAFWRLKEPEYFWIRDVVKYVFFLNLVDFFCNKKKHNQKTTKKLFVKVQEYLFPKASLMLGFSFRDWNACGSDTEEKDLRTVLLLPCYYHAVGVQLLGGRLRRGISTVL